MSTIDAPLPTIVRKALPHDAEAACVVLRRSIELCCKKDHKGDPRILAAWLANKTPENVRSWFSSAGFAVVAETGDRVAGVAMLSESGRLVLNYLVPEALHQGIGRAMLLAIEDEARARGLSELHLESTATAHDFYLRNGYRDTTKAGTFFGLASSQMVKRLA